ncbi:hypothetical protein C8F01DRAFT_992790, partial [Mycena amicta]
NVQVVLSTVPTQAAGSQKAFVGAAKIAGVRLFVPSEYGLPTNSPGRAIGTEERAYLKQIGIPFTRIYTGPRLVGYPETVKIVGEGNAPLSTTAIDDIGSFVAHILTSVPVSELENQTFRLQGDRLHLKDMGTILNAKVEYVDEIPGK